MKELAKALLKPGDFLDIKFDDGNVAGVVRSFFLFKMIHVVLTTYFLRRL
jgi:hypothetical protein